MAGSDRHSGQCHCSALGFEVELSNGLDSARCTCSFCQMRGATAVSARLDGLHIVRGADMLTSYRFNTGVAEHFFARVVEFTPTTSAAPMRTSSA